MFCEGLVNGTCDVVQSVKGEDEDEDRIAKSKFLTVSLRGEYVLYISLPIYYEQRVLLYYNP